MANRKKKRVGIRGGDQQPRGAGARASVRKTTRASKPVRPLPTLDPFAEVAPQPAWVEREFPEYAANAHATGPVSSTRVVYAAGHTIEITTTYTVSIDGVNAPVHMMVDTDGNVWSHVCPYRTFANATELVRYLVERVPDALSSLPAGGEHSQHHAGGHS